MDHTTGFGASEMFSSWTIPLVVTGSMAIFVIDLGMADKTLGTAIFEPHHRLWSIRFWSRQVAIFCHLLIDLKMVDKTLGTATPYSGVTEPPESVIHWRFNQSLCGRYHRLWSVRNVFFVDHTTCCDGEARLSLWLIWEWLTNFGNCKFWTTTQALEHQVLKLEFFVAFVIDLKMVDKTLGTATPYSGVTELPESVIPYCWRLNQS